MFRRDSEFLDKLMAKDQQAMEVFQFILDHDDATKGNKDVTDTFLHIDSLQSLKQELLQKPYYQQELRKKKIDEFTTPSGMKVVSENYNIIQRQTRKQVEDQGFMASLDID